MIDETGIFRIHDETGWYAVDATGELLTKPVETNEQLTEILQLVTVSRVIRKEDRSARNTSGSLVRRIYRALNWHESAARWYGQALALGWESYYNRMRPAIWAAIEERSDG